MNNLEYYLEFYNLKDYLNKELLANCKLSYFKKGDYLSTINKEMEYMYFLVKGKAKVYTLLSTGKSLLLTFDTPLSLIGDIELLDNSVADCSVVTLEECTCISIPLCKVKEFGYNDPEFLKLIIKSLGSKLRNNSNYSSINMLYPLENRFASYLLSLQDSNTLNSTVEIDSLNHVSELLGTSYRHLNRVISTFIKSGTLKKDKNLIEICDLASLKTLAQDIFKSGGLFT